MCGGAPLVAAGAGASRSALGTHTCRRAGGGRRPRSAPLPAAASPAADTGGARREGGGRAEGGVKNNLSKKTLKVWQTSSPAPRASRQRRAQGGGTPDGGGRGAKRRVGAGGVRGGADGSVGGSWGGASAGRGESARGCTPPERRRRIGPAGGAPVAVGRMCPCPPSLPPRPPAARPGAAAVTGSGARISPLCSRILFLIYCFSLPLRLQTHHPRFCSKPSSFCRRLRSVPGGSAPDRHLPGPEFPSASLRASLTARETSLKCKFDAILCSSS